MNSFHYAVLHYMIKVDVVQCVKYANQILLYGVVSHGRLEEF